MGDDKAAAEIAAWRAACEDATVWGDEMRQVMLAAVLGTDRTGRNAAMERILREWAVEQIEACPAAKNYLEISMDYTESTPGLIVVVNIQRAGGETPGHRATHLQAEREAAEQRAEAAEIALAQAHADRALMTGLWLATVPPDVLPALLPADPGDRDRLAAALDAVDLQASSGSHTAAVRAVIGRIVAAAGGAR